VSGGHGTVRRQERRRSVSWRDSNLLRAWRWATGAQGVECGHADAGQGAAGRVQSFGVKLWARDEGMTGPTDIQRMVVEQA
jgi:hypothetical protein